MLQLVYHFSKNPSLPNICPAPQEQTISFLVIHSYSILYLCFAVLAAISLKIFTGQLFVDYLSCSLDYHFSPSIPVSEPPLFLT